MPTNSIRRPQPRLRYFNSLFLTADEFNVEQQHFLALQRYFNYLLFNPGRLHEDDAISPLRVVPGAGELDIIVTPGSAMLIDGQEGFEVVVPDLPVANRQFNLAGLADGDIVTVTLGRGEEDFVAVGSGGGAVGVLQDDRTVELALLSMNLPSDPAPAAPFLTLATITAIDSSPGGGGAADSLNITPAGQRGGVSLAILSEEVRAAMIGSGPSPALAGINIVQPSPVNVTLGSPVSLTVNGSFSTGPDRPLLPTEIDSWVSSNPLLVTVDSSGTIAGVSETPAAESITVSAGGFSDSIAVNVVPVVVPIAFDAGTPFNPTTAAAPSGSAPHPTRYIKINGTGFIDPAATGDVTATTTIDFLDGPDFISGAETVLATSPRVNVVVNGSGTQTLRVLIPPADDWPASESHRVVPRVTFGGSSAVPQNSDVTDRQLRVVIP